MSSVENEQIKTSIIANPESKLSIGTVSKIEPFYIVILEPDIKMYTPGKIIFTKPENFVVRDNGNMLSVSGFKSFIDGNNSKNPLLRAIQYIIKTCKERGATEINCFGNNHAALAMTKKLCMEYGIKNDSFPEQAIQHL